MAGPAFPDTGTGPARRERAGTAARMGSTPETGAVPAGPNGPDGDAGRGRGAGFAPAGARRRVVRAEAVASPVPSRPEPYAGGGAGCERKRDGPGRDTRASRPANTLPAWDLGERGGRFLNMKRSVPASHFGMVKERSPRTGRGTRPRADQRSRAKPRPILEAHGRILSQASGRTIGDARFEPSERIRSPLSAPPDVRRPPRPGRDESACRLGARGTGHRSPRATPMHRPDGDARLTSTTLGASGRRSVRGVPPSCGGTARASQRGRLAARLPALLGLPGRPAAWRQLAAQASWRSGQGLLDSV